MARAGKKLIENASRIVGTENYFVGHEPESPLLVDNVLMFHRKHLNEGGGSFHGRYVLILNLRTRGSVILDDVFFDLHPGHALLVFPYQFHHYANFTSKDISWLFVTFEAIEAKALSALKQTPVPISQEMFGYVTRQGDLYLQGGGLHTEYSRQIILHTELVLSEMLRARAELSDVSSAAGQGGDAEAGRMLKGVGRYLDANMDQVVQIGDIARELAISESHLRNLFRDNIGISLGRYIRRTKISRASFFIGTTDMTFSEVAEACGFTSLYSFSRTFKHELGMSPRDYRKNLRGSKRGR